MRAKKDRVDMTARLIHQPVHLGIDAVEHLHIKETARHAGLVGRHHHRPTSARKLGDRLDAAGDRLPFFRAFDELGAVFVDHAIAIKHQQFHGFILFSPTDELARKPP